MSFYNSHDEVLLPSLVPSKTRTFESTLQHLSPWQ